MTNRRKTLFTAAGAIVLAGIVGVAALWYFLIRDTSPPPVSLESAAATAQAGTPRAGSSASDLTGAWTIPSDSGSFAGYRVNENLVGFGSKTAVGRTQDTQGFLTYDGKAISNLHVSAGLTTLKSDQSLRDDTLKMQAIQSCQFPTATFDLTSPIQIDASSAGGSAVTKTVSGNLTLHGVTKPVSLDVKGQLQNGRLIVVGSTTISFADYSIQQPRSFYVVSLDDHGTMEFQLIFAKSASPTAATPQTTSTPTGCSGGGFPPPNGTPPSGPPPGGAPGGGLPPLNTPAPVPSPVN